MLLSQPRTFAHPPCTGINWSGGLALLQLRQCGVCDCGHAMKQLPGSASFGVEVTEANLSNGADE